MDIDKIDQLAGLMDRTSLTRLELEGDDWALRLERPEPVRMEASIHEDSAGAAHPSLPAQISVFDEPPPSPPVARVEAPLVGVFHEGSPPVEEGQRVRAGEVMGFIEALSLRNEIRSPEGGEVTAVEVEDGQPVEYGQALFTIGRNGEVE
jgi:acetyl-CoA carboxylase biotin carboxyl carrier protein